MLRARNINAILWTISALLCAGAAAAVATGIAIRLDSDVFDEAKLNSLAPTTSPASMALASFEPILQRAWRQPLVEGSRADSATEVALPAGAAQLTLVGTIGNSLALLRRADGSVEVKAVGESIDGAQVLAVRPGEIDIRKDGANVVLCKPKEPEP